MDADSSHDGFRLLFDNKPLEGTRFGPDSYVMGDFLTKTNYKYSASHIFDASARWDFLDRDEVYTRYRGHVLARGKRYCMKGDTGDDELPLVFYKYGFPGFQYRAMLHYNTFAQAPEIADLAQFFDTHFSFRFTGDAPDKLRTPSINHCIATRYEDGDDNIGFHSDKVDDIADNSMIFMLSTGAVRELHFRRVGEENPCAVFVVTPGTLFVLGPETNRLYEHSVVPLKKEKVLSRETVGMRMSLVFRNIKTELSQAELLKKLKMTKEEALELRQAQKRRHIE